MPFSEHMAVTDDVMICVGQPNGILPTIRRCPAGHLASLRRDPLLFLFYYPCVFCQVVYRPQECVDEVEW